MKTLHTIEKLDKNKRYKLECGHKNAVGLNLYPFKTFICLDCGFKTERVICIEEENLNSIKQENIRLSNLLEKIRAFNIRSNSGKSYLNKAVENLSQAIKENWAYYEVSLKNQK